MRRFSRLVVAILIAAALSALAACRYRGTLDEAGYAPAARTKLDATVAFLDDGAFDRAQLVGSTVAYPFTLRMGEALRQAYLRELEATFATVTKVAKLGDHDTNDFYAIPEVVWVAQRPDGDGYAYRLMMRLVIASRQGRSVIADYRETTSVAFRPPAEAQAAAFASGATLFALAPITEPMKRDSFGKEVERSASAGIEELMHRIGKDMTNDQRLEIAAAMGAVQDAAVPPAAPSPYDKFMDAVVVIKADDSLGSGFFASRDMIVTCLHVVGGAAPGEAKGKHVEVRDRHGHSFDGEVVDLSRERDLALIKVAGADFAALPLAPTTPTVGREVIAIGTPQGLSWTVSKGIVSALRMLRTAKVVQTDAALAPGSSGGPLIDPSSGRVVGIASLVMGVRGGSTANFAIAAEEVEKAFGSELSGL